MTAAERNRLIEASEPQRAELLPPQAMRRTGRAYRRMMNERKFKRLFRIVNSSYVPHAGVYQLVLCERTACTYGHLHQISQEQRPSALVQEGIQRTGAQVHGSTLQGKQLPPGLRLLVDALLIGGYNDLSDWRHTWTI